MHFFLSSSLFFTFPLSPFSSVQRLNSSQTAFWQTHYWPVAICSFIKGKAKDACKVCVYVRFNVLLLVSTFFFLFCFSGL